ncbi:hypothetical protein llg_23580 [Luteolibacter sp. LG18]|nr:hypothetical protein llg_23580 [Luteolibacter sp. LG18]
MIVSCASARNIRWFCNPLTTNLTSTGATMDGSFRFELGVFANGFTPTAGNTASWAANWVPAQRTLYNATNRLFTEEYTVVDNTAPFAVGAVAYVWGFGGPTGSEWILFRASTWTWPQADPLNPIALSWNASSATQVIVGSINATTPPSLMRSAAVSSSAPPPTPWPQWQGEMLVGTSQNGPNDDPDGDGVPNALEFILGTDPQLPDRGSAITTAIVEAGGQNYLQLGLPRLSDRTATVVPEVSTDLILWSSGGSVTSVIAATPSLLTVRVLSPVVAGTTRQFVRFRVVP